MTQNPGHADLAGTFDQFESPEQRQARWEAAAQAASREVDRNALSVYMAVADAEQIKLADDWAKLVGSANTKIRRLRAAQDSVAVLVAAVESVIRDYGTDEWRSTKDQVNELRYALRDYKASKDGCPEHGYDCEPDDHVEPPTVNGEVI